MNTKEQIGKLIEEAVKKTLLDIDDAPATFSFIVTKEGMFATAHYENGQTMNFALGQADFALHQGIGNLMLHYSDTIGVDDAQKNVIKILELVKKNVHKDGVRH